MKPSSLKNKSFQEGTFLYFLKKIFLIFLEMKLSSLKNKKVQEGTSKLKK